MRLHGLDESMTEDRKVWSTMVAKVDTFTIVYKTQGEKVRRERERKRAKYREGEGGRVGGKQGGGEGGRGGRMEGKRS